MRMCWNRFDLSRMSLNLPMLQLRMSLLNMSRLNMRCTLSDWLDGLGSRIVTRNREIGRRNRLVVLRSILKIVRVVVCHVRRPSLRVDAGRENTLNRLIWIQNGLLLNRLGLTHSIQLGLLNRVAISCRKVLIVLRKSLVAGPYLVQRIPG